MEAAKVGSACGLLQKGGGRRSAARRLVSARTVKPGVCAGRAEPRSQVNRKDFCSAGMCLRKGKRVNELANERTHNGHYATLPRWRFAKKANRGTRAGFLCVPPFACASRRAWRSGRRAGIKGWILQSRFRPLRPGEVDLSSMLNIET